MVIVPVTSITPITRIKVSLTRSINRMCRLSIFKRLVAVVSSQAVTRKGTANPWNKQRGRTSPGRHSVPG